MSDYHKQIHTLFSDDSFPPMIIFSGKWGAGKTYYVTEHLIEDLKNVYSYNVTYISTMGISSLDDFKDLIVSKRYLEKKHDSNGVSKLIELFGSIEKNSLGNNAITSVLKGSTGAIKHYMLKNISNELFIIDDIERIEDCKLKKNIIGECLRLTENNNKFLFVTVDDELKLDKSFTEKVFSDSIIFSLNSFDIFSIFKPKFVHLTDSQNHIEEFINKHELYNLRVLNRTFKRLEALLKYVNELEDVNYELLKGKIINDGLHISKMYYIENRTVNEIISTDEDKKEKIKLKIRGSLTLNELFVRYIIGRHLSVTDVFNVDELPKKKSLLDTLLFEQPFSLSDSEFIRGVSELKYYILTEINVEIRKFFECCFYHEYLVDNSYIPKDESIIFDTIRILADQKTFINYRSNRSLSISNPKYKDIADEYIEKLDIETAGKEISDLYESLQVSFKRSMLYMGNNYKTRPILNKFTVTQWKSLIKGWTFNEIGYFSDYLFGRYRTFSHTYNFSEEKETLEKLLNFVKLELANQPVSPKKGTLNRLEKALYFSFNKLDTDNV
ncbi:hypothetical protein HHL01_01105 [Pseudoalteromonas arctica]|uniref:KAP NTPase domain-containing protein n=1 Tax=Pseudoalteromonas arctica TaxID=394751 RepID=A0A7X9YDZ4_9GAMM|nr:hypothetical protein [Pseudoalteromonas arctica]NMF46785.1 hypothetical protein [Pseudoalteromonas arctica]